MKKVGGRLWLLTLVLVGSFVSFLPSYPPLYQAMPSWLKTVLPNKGITLGLDLQGGIHMVLEVDEDRAVEIAVDRSVTALQDLVTEKKIAVDSVKRVGHEQITVQIQNADAKSPTQKLIDNFPSFVENESAESAATVVWVLREAETKRIKDSAINQALETIRNRIDQFGVAEPIVQRQGLKQIVVQLPGVKDPKRAKDLIKETALLEFKMLDEDIRLDLPGHVSKDKEAEVLQQFESKLPEGDQILFERVVDKDTGVEFRAPYVVRKRVMLTGDVLSDARVAIGQFNDPYVSITFDSKGGQEFERITAEHVKKRMAVVLDNTIYSAPVIQERIAGGRAQITGTFTTQEANDLAIVLRAGALPAPLKIVQDLTVGPSLGQDSIDKGVRATLIAGVMVVVFMIVYYRLSGLIADFALALNLICLMGALSALTATLTLPGIAGIVLTIGMGVDSNVLIFERIREELRSGKAVRSAIDAGYDKALLTIIDSHVTTLITGVALFLFGTGPIKGFAVTLCLGIAINLFTALVGTKVIFDLLYQKQKVEALSI
ncbi:Protein translocase, subunit SecD [Candidatus Nitrospira nitrosa]|uniref:Protein translocase subunit SecD n=1 Tax=Candidatus Nitrospira nitrosa TaxID=1742972 RepID=A0A0S4LD14_9BACT|nr:protein translocase subunit SecD [Candidatus Nitrospira nitrosa]CUS35507.1 Protein translocase, subunit SecD [Candidatus Nitrospira nitrosa]